MLIKIAAAVVLLAIGFGLSRWIRHASDAKHATAATVAADAYAQQTARRLESERMAAPRAARDASAGRGASAQAAGAAMFKCQSSSGAESIQSEPCSAREETAWARPVIQPSEYREAYEAQNRAAEIRRNEEAVRRYTQMYGDGATPVFTAPSQSAIVSAQRRARCEVQKNYREEVLRQVGLNRTFDLLRQLDDLVYEACKGV